MAVFIAVRRDKIRTVRRAIDGDFTFRAAAHGADFLPFGGTEPLRLALLTDRTGHGISLEQQTIQQNTLRREKRQKCPAKRLGFDDGRFRWEWGLLRFAAFAFLDSLTEEILDLAVDAAQFVLRPGFNVRPERRIDA